ncbi:MAG: peptidylprolyl isomerase [Deltaproteobacteria bacterium]|nr:peptidylprolyl isomerase [Deltaproteobacteria bacterium]MBW1937365.1 peptidylprolyl isomerase [Deltaproteobacteria bacterium]MBW1964217.1 peptidylprolyl isomerase [Deltaproteobacteria bacterium]MBW2350077.1 peptidylprolyl isomerase [Deltaproteobacteria bacterium]
MKKALWLIVFVFIPSVAFSYLVRVNNESIEAEDFKEVFTRSHVYAQMGQKNKPGVLTEKSLEEALKNLIDHHLLAQEAKRLNLDQEPDYLQGLDYYKRYLATRAFWQEEFKKINIPDEEIEKYFQEKNTRWRVRQIFTKERNKAEKALRQLKNGETFAKVAQELSEGPYAAKGGDLGFMRKGQMVEEWETAAFSLKPGNFGDIVETHTGFHIIKLEEIKSPNMEALERQKPGVKKNLLKNKQKTVEKKWKNKLRADAEININGDLLKEINENIGDIETNEKVIAQVNGEPIYLKDFLPLFKRKLAGYSAMKERWHIKIDSDKVKNEVVDILINQKVIEHEALKRKYFKKNRDIKKQLDNYKRTLLVKTFKGKIVAPQISLSEKELENYYKKNEKDYLGPAQYDLRLIEVKSKKTAEGIRDELLAGADFPLLAREKSIAASARKGGKTGWVSERFLPEKIKKEVERLKPGEITPVIEKDIHYVIVQLKEKKQGQLIPFTEVEEIVKKTLWSKKFDDFLNKYLEKLRKISKIKFNKKAFKAVEGEFGIK